MVCLVSTMATCFRIRSGLGCLIASRASTLLLLCILCFGFRHFFSWMTPSLAPQASGDAASAAVVDLERRVSARLLQLADRARPVLALQAALHDAARALRT